MKHRFFRLMRGGAALLSAALLLVALWQLAARALLGEKLPFLFGYAGAVVLSGSMEPTISAGDLLVIHREEGYRAGDIVSFWEGGSLITHRIVEKTPEGFVTQGDFNNAPDAALVPPERIAGRVVGRLPRVGNALLFLRTPSGVLLLLAAGLLTVFFPGRLKRREPGEKRCAK